MLEQLFERNVRSLSRDPGPMPEAMRCLRVDAVAPHSIAAGVGLSKGDLLVSVDGKDASGIDSPNLSLFEVEERRCELYTRGARERVMLHATGIPLGLRLGSTVEALRMKARPDDQVALLELWELGEWGTLGRITSREVKRLTPERGMMDKLLGRPDVIPETLALAFLGAAEYETGKKEAGLQKLRHFDETIARKYTTDVGALPKYYAARDCLERGDRAAAASILEGAYLGSTDSERLLDLMEQVFGERPPRRQRLWLGGGFPAPYELEAWYGDAPPLSLEGTLRAMPDRKLLLVCVLAHYRANGPYYDFVCSYINYARYFAEYLHGLHVITSNPNTSEFADRWLGAESRAIDLGLPIEIGLEDGSIANGLRIPGSPYLAVLNKAGQVVHEHDLTELDVWRLAAAC